MIEKQRAGVDDGLLGRAILSDLSKVFDCINHGLLIAKLTAFGFRCESPNLFEVT